MLLMLSSITVPPNQFLAQFRFSRMHAGGAPLAGKGTQCSLLAEALGAVHVSMRWLLQAEVDTGNLELRDYMARGELAPDALVLPLLLRRLTQPDVAQRGFVLEGFPRTDTQADALQRAAEEASDAASRALLTPDVMIFLDVPDELVIRRAGERRIDPVTGKIYSTADLPAALLESAVAERLQMRDDDFRDLVMRRLQVFYDHISPILDHYADILVRLDGSRPTRDVFAACVRSLVQVYRRVVTQSESSTPSQASSGNVAASSSPASAPAV
jgi:adenylate kinase